jgi:hypothetical protein
VVTAPSAATFTATQGDGAPPWWAGLAAATPGATVFSDPRWLELFAGSRGEPPAWWFAAQRQDRPVVGLRGTVVQAGTRTSMNPYRWLFEDTPYRDERAFDPTAAPERASWFPALLCSYPGLDSYPVGAGDDPELVGSLLDGVAGWAAGRGIATVVLGFAQPERAGLAAGATAAGYTPLPVAVRATLPVSAEDPFPGYSAQQRYNVRRLRRRLADRGVRVEELPEPLAELDTLVELRCAHARQHGKQADPAEERSWLGPLLRLFPERVTVYGAFTGAELRGFALFVDDGRLWNAFAVARTDPDADRDAYFELMYHTPTERAAGRGVTELSFGYGTAEAKRRRGCTLTPVPAWYRATSAADPAVARWLAARAADPAVAPWPTGPVGGAVGGAGAVGGGAVGGGG